MKYIFVYGILQLNLQGKEFGLTKDKYIGRGILDNYRRINLSSIQKAETKVRVNGKPIILHKVCGDIFHIEDDIEEDIYNFEHSCGYKRETVSVKCVNDNKIYKCIIYL